MRTLHKVAAHEAFLASGIYRYYRAGEEIAVTEKWTIHELAGGAMFYRVDEDGRDEDGLSILSEALFSPESRIERYNVQSFNSRDRHQDPFKADYSFYEGYVQIGRKKREQEHEYEEFDLLDGCLVYIKQTLFMGLTIRDILARDDKRSHVFVPQLISSEEVQVQRIQARMLEIEPVVVGKKEINAQKVQIADDVFYWLDEHHIPLKRQYNHEGILYEARLGDYAHR